MIVPRTARHVKSLAAAIEGTGIETLELANPVLSANRAWAVARPSPFSCAVIARSRWN
jgi:hypothetical protein